MKKPLVALAALAVSSVFAQSSVTISGLADVGLTYSNVKKQNVFPVPLNYNNKNPFDIGIGYNNRITFAGVEDLGGGLAATFATTMRFNPATGTAEFGGARPLFQGETTVGLRGGFGSLKLGRWFSAVQLLNGGTIDPWSAPTMAGMHYANGYSTSYEAGGEGRIGQAMFYSSPNFGGFAGHLTLGFAKGETGKTLQSLAGSYNNGPINAMLGYERNKEGDSLASLGANYDLGVAKLYAGYGRVKGGSLADRGTTAYASVTSSAFIGGLNSGTAPADGQGNVTAGGTVTNATIGANIPLGAATLRVGYARVAGDVFGAVPGRTTADSKLGLGVNYALSKRTAIYSDVALMTNNKVLANGVAGTSGARRTGFDLGIAHSF